MELRGKGPLRSTQEAGAGSIHGGSGLAAQSPARDQPNGILLQYVRIEVARNEYIGHALGPVVQKYEEILKYPRDSKDRLAPGSRLVGQPESVSQNPTQFRARRQERQVYGDRSSARRLERLHQRCIDAFALGEIVLSEDIALDFIPTLTGATMPHRLASQQSIHETVVRLDYLGSHPLGEMKISFSGRHGGVPQFHLDRLERVRGAYLL